MRQRLRDASDDAARASRHLQMIHNGQMIHNVALVLGGGGAAGQAWQIGIIAGLAEAGLDMTEAADLQRAMGAFGLESDSILGPRAGQQRRAMVAARLPRPQWPDRPMIVVAVNAHTGELAAFDRDSGVDLADAVTASTALPGVVPTHNINGASRAAASRRSHRTPIPVPRWARTRWIRQPASPPPVPVSPKASRTPPA
jgi:predicted acylesterase/phospholipase RssA